MRVRDRLVVAVIAAVVLAGAMWTLLVSPERAQVASLTSQITTERGALVTAQGHLASARRAAAAYVGHVHEIDAVMRAVPSSPAEAALIRTITKFAGTKIDVHELDVGANAATATGPLSLGLTFAFNTSYVDLQSFLAALDALTTTDGTSVSSSGRLFTFTSVSLSPAAAHGTKATIVAQVYEQGAGVPAATGATASPGAPTPTPTPAATPGVTR